MFLLTFLIKCLTGRRPPMTPQTLSNRTMPCFIRIKMSVLCKASLQDDRYEVPLGPDLLVEHTGNYE